LKWFYFYEVFLRFGLRVIPLQRRGGHRRWTGWVIALN
jgi:hypothetical protein